MIFVVNSLDMPVNGFYILYFYPKLTVIPDADNALICEIFCLKRNIDLF